MKAEVFIKNRENLFKAVEENSAVILFAGKAPKKTADEAYSFTPNRNFYYLTGIDEEEITLILVKKKDEQRTILFVKEPDLEMEKWVGKSIRANEAKEKGGFTEVLYTKEFEGTIHGLIFKEEIEKVYFDLEKDGFAERETLVEEFARNLKNKYPQVSVKNIYNSIAELRLVKSSEEVENMQKAVDITIEGVEALMKNSKPGMMEYELEAYYDFSCKRRGATDAAFKTIAAAGVNATILHYVDNNSIIKDGDLILFDLGSQYEYYNADITRTFPANGKFTERQKQVYEAVLRVNKKVIDEIKPGVNWGDINTKATDWVAEECIALGLIDDKKDVRKYYWHSIGHSLGLDTHDVGKRNVELKPGMVYTVEPGIYIAEEGIGVRIEDDILVTEDGNEILTKAMIKEVSEIEEFFRNR